MESGIKISNAVLVVGITEEVGEEAIDFLKHYGSINSTQLISKPQSDFDGSLVVEFTNACVMESLHPILLYTMTNKERLYISELSAFSTEHFTIF